MIKNCEEMRKDLGIALRKANEARHANPDSLELSEQYETIKQDFISKSEELMDLYRDRTRNLIDTVTWVNKLCADHDLVCAGGDGDVWIRPTDGIIRPYDTKKLPLEPLIEWYKDSNGECNNDPL